MLFDVTELQEETCPCSSQPRYKMGMEREAAEEDENEFESNDDDDDDKSHSESEDVARTPILAGRGGARGIVIPGLAPSQIKKLLDLATKADSSLDELQDQIS